MEPVPYQQVLPLLFLLWLLCPSKAVLQRRQHYPTQRLTVRIKPPEVLANYLNMMSTRVNVPGSVNQSISHSLDQLPVTDLVFSQVSTYSRALSHEWRPARTLCSISMCLWAINATKGRTLMATSMLEDEYGGTGRKVCSIVVLFHLLTFKTCGFQGQWNWSRATLLP